MTSPAMRAASLPVSSRSALSQLLEHLPLGPHDLTILDQHILQKASQTSAPGLTFTSMISPAMGAATLPGSSGSALSRVGRRADLDVGESYDVLSTTSTTRGTPLDSKKTSLQSHRSLTTGSAAQLKSKAYKGTRAFLLSEAKVLA